MPKLPNPRHRLERLRRDTFIPETANERMVFVVMYGPEKLNELVPMKPWKDTMEVDSALVQAWDLFNIPEQRVYVEACLFSTDNDHQIASSFRVDVEVLQYYREFFFDTTVFPHTFAVIPYLASLEDNTLEKSLMTMAFHGGFDALRFHFSRDKTLVSEEEVLRTTMTDAFFRSQAHRGRPLTHKAAKESLKWAHTAITCGKMLLKEDAQPQSTGDIAFKFRDGQSTTSIHQLETDGIEVLH